MITASVVLYNTPIKHVERCVDSIIKSKLIDYLYVIDNSPTPILYSCLNNPLIIYIKNINSGYGSAHNVALHLVSNYSSFHFILNPDIYFDANSIKSIIERIDGDPFIGIISPKILNPNGSLYYGCKLLPTPLNLFIRCFRLNTFSSLAQKFNLKYELRFFSYDFELNIPNLSGCFMLIRVEVLKDVGFFDENFFMYLEDIDFCRRVHKLYKTLYFPAATIYHLHEKASYKSIYMFLLHIISAIKYFNKWGWFFDADRLSFNNLVLRKLKSPFS